MTPGNALFQLLAGLVMVLLVVDIEVQKDQRRAETADHAAQLEAVKADLRNATDRLRDTEEDLKTCRASYTQCAAAVNACNGRLRLRRARPACGSPPEGSLE